MMLFTFNLAHTIQALVMDSVKVEIVSVALKISEKKEVLINSSNR
jgi:hypothetical protein